MAKLDSIIVKGLNSKNVKRCLLLNDLKSLFNKDGNIYFESKSLPSTYMTSQDRKNAGVAILLSSYCPIQITKFVIDPMVDTLFCVVYTRVHLLLYATFMLIPDPI